MRGAEYQYVNASLSSKRRWGLWTIPGGLGLVLGGLWLAGVFHGARPIPPEKIVTVERGDVARSVVARRKVEARSSVGIKSKANGIIKALWVDVGEPVTEGQVLAELDKEDLAAQLREAKAGGQAEEANLKAAMAAETRARLEAANPELAFVRRDLERAQGLFKERIASQQQLDDAERAFQTCSNRQQLLEAAVECAAAQTQQVRARVAAAKAAVERAEENLGYATIRSPINGIVLWRPTEVGHPVSSLLNLGSAASLIMVLGDLSSVYVKGAVDEADVGKAQLQQRVRTRVEAYPNELFEGVVQRIAPMGQDQGNVTTFEVRVTIANPQGSRD